MRQRLLLLTSILALGAMGWQSVVVRQAEAEPSVVRAPAADPLTGDILLDLDDDLDDEERSELVDRVREAIEPYSSPAGAAALGEMLSSSAQLYRLSAPESEVDDIRQALRGHEDVESVELERIWSLPESAMAVGDLALNPDPEPSRGEFRPNDPYYKHQWHLDQIQMPAAWQRTRGDGVVVAVIDTGVLYRDAEGARQAPDLAGTSFTDGWDFVDGDNTPDDAHGHGTHVAGTVAQTTNNGVGVAGVAPEATIMPIRVLDARGAGRWGSVAAGIRWAADNGAHIINLSLGGGTPSAAIRSAIVHAHAKGVVVIAAAGNTGRGRVQYPAAHRHAVAVGAVRFDEQLSFYSSYGRHLDIVAPGGDLRVDQNEDGLPDGVLQNTMVRGNPGRHDYLAYQGTSMAAPHVAGVAALIRAAGVTDPSAIERILKESAKTKSDTRRYGAGLLQANDALRAATTDLGGAGGLMAGLFALLFVAGARRRLGVGVIAIGLAGSALILPFDVLAWVAGAMGGAWPLVFGAALPLAAVALTYQWERARPALAGLSFGLGAWLVVQAVAPTVAVAVSPTLALAMGPFLLLNAAVCVWLGRQTLA